ncbi:hypothetical protein RvY_07555 [Ramazzottius varieornatus]|uniref:Uncharacterized protein n=1 Tax=Ramazzottius varieornatus TaxID=947166 RepID=A0A1D1V5P1_RAMVA|nr:hypothetical protein RvY_07555 [Ramazzottius varieornatus]
MDHFSECWSRFLRLDNSIHFQFLGGKRSAQPGVLRKSSGGNEVPSSIGVGLPVFDSDHNQAIFPFHPELLEKL